jgi:hypothetical protein
VIGEMFGTIGCEATWVEDGEEAVRLCQKANDNGRPFAAVVVNLTIPGGREAVGTLMQIDPEPKRLSPAATATLRSGRTPAATGLKER